MNAPAKIVKLVPPAAAKKFLVFLDEGAVEFGVPFAFQTYDDDQTRKDPGRARTYIGTFESQFAQLAEANKNGCAIHITINDTGSKRRTSANVVQVRKHFIEVDGTMTQPEIIALGQKLGLPVAWINESSPGHFHAYWNVADDAANDLAGFTTRQKKLVKLFNAGVESVDLSRVLRLPGFWHQKGEAFQVRITYQNPKAPRLTIADFDKALAGIEVDDPVEAIRDVEYEEDAVAIAAATEHFKTYVAAVSNTRVGKLGKQGNNTTYDAIVMARDLGVDEQTCLDLAWTHYNPRCNPPWDFEPLRQLVENVYRYGKNKQGSKHPTAMAIEDFEADPITDAEILEFSNRQTRWSNEQKARKAKLMSSTAAPGFGHNSGLRIIHGKDLKLRNVDFIWQLRLARGKHTAAAGEGGKGKSQIAYDIGARITNGADWPDGGTAPLGTIIILSAEDDPNDAMGPRLKAAGANMDHVVIIKATTDSERGDRKFNLQADMDKLRNLCQSLNARPGKPPVMLIIIDPVSSYMGGDIDTHRNTAVRHVLDPLNQLAEDVQCAILSISHFNKGSGGKAIHRVMESAAFVNAPRAAFGMFDGQEGAPEGEYLFLPLKSNIGKKSAGWKYRIEDSILNDVDGRTGERIKTSRIKWIEPTDVTADQVVRAESERKKPKTTEAKTFLLAILASGPMLVAEVRARAADEGISKDTLLRAKRELGIVLINTEDVPPKRMWALPATGETVAGDDSDFA
jgi:putative DNA primase/helicase